MSDKKNSDVDIAPPKLVRRHENKKSSFRSGRTIGEKRERLETANERFIARKKVKRRQVTRIIITVLGFLALVLVMFLVFTSFKPKEEPADVTVASGDILSPEPTIEIIDEDSGTSGDNVTSRMKTFIGQAEAEFRLKGYQPTKVVIPTRTIREVDFYLEDYPGFIKFIIDRGPAESVEDADRVLRYLSGIGVNDFSYVDVRVSQKAFWK